MLIVAGLITECSSSDRSVLFVLGRWLNPFKPPRSLLLYFKELCEHRVKTNVNMQSELSLQHYFYIVCLPTMILRASISVHFCSLGLAIIFLVLVFLVCCSCRGCFSVPYGHYFRISSLPNPVNLALVLDAALGLCSSLNPLKDLF